MNARRRPAVRQEEPMKLVLVALLASVLVTPATQAQETQTQQGVAGEPYVPRIGEIMALQQIRHIKLWFAGRSGNWPLADYEIDALKQSFDDVNKQIGGDTVQQAVGAAVSALEKAIDAKDRAAFTDAFDRLSAGCNSCHRSLDHAFIVIQRPASLPYSDQSFAAPK
ncbi:MAG: hypothetical protein P4L80_16815 [Xanthobacteraceae bacterium]|nr:hypothetical protein [Xanthobacteraceae bacterium]